MKKLNALWLGSMLVLLIAIGPVTSFSQTEESITEIAQAMKQADDAFKGIRTYKAEAILQERHNGRIAGIEKVETVYRKTPLSVYFFWKEDNLFGGLQASFVADRDGPDHFMGYGTGAQRLVGVKRWHLDSKIIKQLYPHHLRTNQYQLSFLLDHMREIFEKAKSKDKLSVTSEGLVDDPVSGIRLKMFTIILSDNPSDGLLYSKCVIGFDEKTKLPLKMAAYNFSGELHSSYQFANIRINSELDPSAFKLRRK